MDDLTAVAEQQLNRVKVLLTQADLQYVEIPSQSFGVGVGVAFGEADYVVLSVMGGGLENQLMMTSGVLLNITRDRLAALDACNGLARENTNFSVYLHDAEAGWAVLIQHTSPLELMLDSPSALIAYVRGLPTAAAEYRHKLSESWSLGGRPWAWNYDDLGVLLIRSML